MKKYTSKSGKASGVIAYELGEDFIRVQFAGNEVYTYTYSSAGEAAVKIMTILALNQKGLSTYIAQNRPAFESWEE